MSFLFKTFIWFLALVGLRTLFKHYLLQNQSRAERQNRQRTRTSEKSDVYEANFRVVDKS